MGHESRATVADDKDGPEARHTAWRDTKEWRDEVDDMLDALVDVNSVDARQAVCDAFAERQEMIFSGHEQ